MRPLLAGGDAIITFYTNSFTLAHHSLINAQYGLNGRHHRSMVLIYNIQRNAVDLGDLAIAMSEAKTPLHIFVALTSLPPSWLLGLKLLKNPKEEEEVGGSVVGAWPPRRKPCTHSAAAHSRRVEGSRLNRTDCSTYDSLTISNRFSSCDMQRYW